MTTPLAIMRDALTRVQLVANSDAVQCPPILESERRALSVAKLLINRARQIVEVALSPTGSSVPGFPPDNDPAQRAAALAYGMRNDASRWPGTAGDKPASTLEPEPEPEPEHVRRYPPGYLYAVIYGAALGSLITSGLIFAFGSHA